MKRVFVTTVCLCLMLLCGTQAKAQTTPTIKEQWRAAFSAEGRKNWMPEFTARASMGFYEVQKSFSAGIKVDDYRTIGIMYAQSVSGSSSSDTDYLSKVMAHYRRYFPRGKKGTLAFYSDLNLGVAIVTKVKLGPFADKEEYHAKPGDWGPMLEWQPGIRLRLFANAHIFLGPSITFGHTGLHIGVGF